MSRSLKQQPTRHKPALFSGSAGLRLIPGPVCWLTEKNRMSRCRHRLSSGASSCASTYAISCATIASALGWRSGIG